MILYKKKYTKIYFRALYVGFVSAQLMQVRFHHIHKILAELLYYPKDYQVVKHCQTPHNNRS